MKTKTINCPLCSKIILENITLEEYIAKYPDEKYMWCAYCHRTFPIHLYRVEKEEKNMAEDDEENEEEDDEDEE